MKSELSGIFLVKLTANNIAVGSLDAHFMHMMVKHSFEKQKQHG